MSDNSTSIWQIKEASDTIIQKLSAALNKPKLIAQLLLNRGVRSLKEAQLFITPQPPSPDEFYLKPENLEAAGSLLQKHIEAKHHIYLYGDYDVDGITSTAQFIQFLNETDAKVTYHIPNRFTEGYGLSHKTTETILQKKPDLLITLDCGISNEKEINYLKEQSSMDILILDHHIPPDKKPPATVILNPKDLPEDNPAYHLCTAGLVYIFLSYVTNKYYPDVSFNTHIDLAACGTIADIVPLIGVNRHLAREGLRQLGKRTNMGLKHLLIQSNHTQEHLTARDIGFMIAPRLNAAGRLDHAKKSVELLTSETSKDAQDLAKYLDKLNRDRQKIGEHMFKSAQDKLNAEPHLLDNKCLVLWDDHWHRGVIGITAARLVQQYHKPVVLIANTNDYGHASARSVDQVNIYALLNQCKTHFDGFGGHTQAAGFSIKKKSIETFSTQLITLANQTIESHQLKKVYTIDTEVHPTDLTLEMAQDINTLGPFGEGNPVPLLYTNKLTPIDFKTVGNGDHIKVTFQNKEHSLLIDGIGFRLAHKMKILYNKHVELVFHLDINEWRGTRAPQLQIIDIK